MVTGAHSRGFLMASLGEKLRERRKAMGLTLDSLAERVGSSKSYIWELENRPSPNPSAEKLAAIAKELNAPVEYFLDTAEAAPTPEQRDDAFFRKFRNLPEEDKDQLRAIMETFRKRSRK